MLTIKNIKQLELNFCHQRGLREITEEKNRGGDNYYSFHFGPIGDGKEWNNKIEVRLGRDVEFDGSYRIFVMGLQLVTENNIFRNDIKTKDGLVTEISKVLARAEHWWKAEVTS